MVTNRMDLTGAVLDDNYELLQQLGAGGMGAVYLARDTRLERKVAIKLLLPDAAREPEFKKRFCREAQLLAKLRSPNVVKFMAWGFWQQTHPYLVMELLTGESLAAALPERRKLPWQEAFEIGIQVCNGLESLHDLGIIHRDLSPSNIYVCSGEPTEIKIIDLGLAGRIDSSTATEDLTATGLLMGSLHYMSPEICGGNKATKQSDVYALGCIIYEMISGEKAIDGDNPIAVVYKHANEYPAPLKELIPAIPDTVQAVVFKSIQKQLSQRYNSIAELRNDLTHALKGDVQKLNLTSSWHTVDSTSTARRRLLPALAAILIMIGAFAATARLFSNPKHLVGALRLKQSAKQPFFSVKNPRLQAYVIDARYACEPPSPAQVESQVKQWLQFDNRRSTNENLLYLAAVYEDLSEFYKDIGDHSNSQRVWKLHDNAVAAYKPVGDAQQQARLFRQLIGYRHYAMEKDEAVASTNIEAYLRAVAKVSKENQDPNQVASVLARKTMIAISRQQWTNAFNVAATCLGDHSHLNADQACTICRKLVVYAPDSMANKKIQLLQKYLRYLQSNKPGQHRDPTGRALRDTAFLGFRYMETDTFAVDDNNPINLSTLMILAEFSATQGQYEMARSWVDLFATWKGLRNTSLDEILEFYNLEGSTPSRARICKRVLAIVETVDRHNDESRQLYPARCLDEETLRLCALYPAFSLKFSAPTSGEIQETLKIFSAIRRAEPARTLQTAGASFAECRGFDSILESFLLDSSRKMNHPQFLALLQQYSNDSHLESIRSNLVRFLEKTKANSAESKFSDQR